MDGLKKSNYISMLIDASNHKAIKLVPIIVRYFCPEIGVKTKFQIFSAGETVDLIHNKILSVLENLKSEKK